MVPATEAVLHLGTHSFLVNDGSKSINRFVHMNGCQIRREWFCRSSEWVGYCYKYTGIATILLCMLHQEMTQMWNGWNAKCKMDVMRNAKCKPKPATVIIMSHLGLVWRSIYSYRPKRKFYRWFFSLKFVGYEFLHRCGNLPLLQSFVEPLPQPLVEHSCFSWAKLSALMPTEDVLLTLSNHAASFVKKIADRACSCPQ